MEEEVVVVHQVQVQVVEVMVMVERSHAQKVRCRVSSFSRLGGARVSRCCNVAVG